MDVYPETAVNTQSIAEPVLVLIAITNSNLRALTVAQGALLPNGLPAPSRHSLQAGVRVWAAKQTSQPMGHVEQFYTFVDAHRQNGQGLPVLYVSYLGLVRETADSILHPDAKRQDCYSYFPREDLHTDGGQRDAIVSRLRIRANSADTEEVRQKRPKCIHLCWGVEPGNWSEEHALQRYEMLYESGLITEAAEPQANFDFMLTGQLMCHDYRCVLATALSHLRAEIKYRPVTFELMPPEFTLLWLQNSVEAISGRLLHKQNFRRQIQQQNLTEPSDTGVSGSKDRPAQPYRLRNGVLPDRLISDIGLPLGGR